MADRGASLGLPSALTDQQGYGPLLWVRAVDPGPVVGEERATLLGMASLPHRAQSRRQRLLGPGVAALGTVAAWGAVALIQPGDAGATWCPWRALTGLDCPFCGATRAAGALAHGELVTALDHNAFFVLVVLPVAILLWVRWAMTAWRGQPAPLLTNRSVFWGVGITLGWWLLRLGLGWAGFDWLGSSAN